MTYLVTGGAGYIGSFMVKRLLDDGHQVVVVDSLERGYEDALDRRAINLQGDLADDSFLASLFREHTFTTVMHFAAYISVAESVSQPGLYFRNNVLTTLKLLEAMQQHGVKQFIFSSTGTVYGTPEQQPIPETHPKAPENPYAESKRMVEEMVKWYYRAHGIGYVILRYFNASGAALDGSMGERHDPETHMIPNAMKAAKEKTEFFLYGDDYDTSDGSAVRDYIHVLDLIEAHMITARQLNEQNGEYIYNVGTGKGITNKEVIQMVQKISGVTFPVVIKPRRDGDVSETVADITKIQSELNFAPKYSDLETIISTAWKWHSRGAAR